MNLIYTCSNLHMRNGGHFEDIFKSIACLLCCKTSKGKLTFTVCFACEMQKLSTSSPSGQAV
uniref:Uncharacterized protein n=1 Tax=Arundo donax TaxID=35708 RepID=A0A0A9CKY6_ARUDO